jgi:hypothetical protein
MMYLFHTDELGTNLSPYNPAHGGMRPFERRIG